MKQQNAKAASTQREENIRNVSTGGDDDGGSSIRTCSLCQLVFPREGFSSNQWSKNEAAKNAKAVLWRACVLVAINMSLNNNIPRVNGPKVTLENAKIALINVNWKIKRKLRLIKFARTIVFILKTG